MNPACQSTNARVAAAWISALTIALLALAAESLPVAFGTGRKASWDWGLVYVTLRFGVLPSASIAHMLRFGSAASRLFRERRIAAGCTAGLSLTVPCTYLALLWKHPLFWFP